MTLEPYGPDDGWLIEAMETDPRVMARLGGPLTKEQAAAAHARRSTLPADHWYFKIVPEPGAQPIGTIGLWPSEWAGVKYLECGWMLLAEHHGRGHAKRALALMIERARTEFAGATLAAFPALDNPASNALCRGAGFVPHEEVALEYAGRPLKCRRWTLRLP